MTVDEDEKDVTIEKAYDNYRDFGVAYEPKPVRKAPEPEEVPEEKKQELELPEELEDIINNNSVTVTKEVTEVKVEYTPQEDKIDEEEFPEETKKEETPEVKEEIPTREEKKKEAKVDDDFFELIDSMYKERIDD